MVKRKTRSRRMYIIAFCFLAYLVFCQSCMTMRMGRAKAAGFFSTAGVKYVDSTVIVENHPLHYIQTGDCGKPTLFFIHGSPGSWDAYKQYLTDTLLLEKFRMIAVDRPGFGYSSFGTAEGLAVQARLLAGLIKKLDNHTPVVLIGHSLGGPIAVKMAVNEPLSYQHLILLAAAVDPGAEKPEKWRYIIKQKPLRYLIPGALRPSNDELWLLKQELIDMQPQLKDLTAGVTIIHGTKDGLVPYRNVPFMKKEFINAKNVKVISIKDANHFIPWEHYGEIRDALLTLQL
ncbi:hypothetical protein CHU92_02225 [Flavobacterium cyanobacteriorum]|uniref:AB hydrolase-1 domain-containing protein n=1 Tax=Flavobacterium cyanobacteriorum TaxID=2022802 RepID=A0A255ZUD5_9FLAO|nr:alpha/beta hydrolase [Flavobacterium cyanobacteriorum]OYQ45108.1 hypothetical protein CHU92_02225 [Flavobacterium cyanobacteriorum]